MRRFSQGIHKNDLYGPKMIWYQLHDPLGHREVHGGGVRQVQKYGNIYMCDACFIAKILQRIQKYEINRPHFTLSHLHDPRVHQEVHGGGVDQVLIFENIYVRYMFYT